MNTTSTPHQVTVYSKPSCVQCTMTYRKLDNAGISYIVVDVTEDEDAVAFIKDQLGYLTAPVVFVSEDLHWGGFRPDLIEGLAATLAATNAA
ncbi:glutaredoxin domain-containing protein [Subtercola vilae]|uniref:NrdH-redoxin n=1 Tax=Subtercola vilae TaxID=2056433 RepID=A0A4T2B745_9MICO|nr:glutaredoxin domain-containing protein [Subtercola vilae]TIH26667.1 NrdH-redoxin [Subtercola vilae]